MSRISSALVGGVVNPPSLCLPLGACRLQQGSPRCLLTALAGCESPSLRLRPPWPVQPPAPAGFSRGPPMPTDRWRRGREPQPMPPSRRMQASAGVPPMPTDRSGRVPGPQPTPTPALAGAAPSSCRLRPGSPPCLLTAGAGGVSPSLCLPLGACRLRQGSPPCLLTALAGCLGPGLRLPAGWCSPQHLQASAGVPPMPTDRWRRGREPQHTPPRGG